LLLRVLCALCGILVFLAATPVAAARTLVPLDGPAVEAELISIDSSGAVVLRSASEPPSTLPFSRVVRWGNPLPPRPQIIVVLADGGRLLTAAAWSGGAPVRLEGNSVIVLTDAWGELVLPRPQVQGIVFAQRNHPRDRERLEETVRRLQSAQGGATTSDIVLLSNKDRVAGNISGLSGGSLELSNAAGTVKLPLSRVEAVVLQNRLQPVDLARRPVAAVGTNDGSLLYALQVVGDEKNVLMVGLAGNLKLTGGSVSDLTLLQSMSDQVVYLSDVEPADYRHVPYLSIEWPLQRDRNARGEPLTVAGQRYLKGIGMHSASRVTYRLDGKYRRFDALVAVDDSGGERGSVTFGVYVLQDGQWRPAYASSAVRGGDPPQPVSVDTSKAQGITLTVDFADRGDEMDHADWLDARLVR
jgi:hypothetical protein